MYTIQRHGRSGIVYNFKATKQRYIVESYVLPVLIIGFFAVIGFNFITGLF